MAEYVIKNNNQYYHWEFLKSYWVDSILEATVYNDDQTDQNCTPSWMYVIDGLNRYDGFPDAKIVEVERFYKEKVTP